MQNRTHLGVVAAALLAGVAPSAVPYRDWPRETVRTDHRGSPTEQSRRQVAAAQKRARKGARRTRDWLRTAFGVDRRLRAPDPHARWQGDYGSSRMKRLLRWVELLFVAPPAAPYTSATLAAWRWLS